MSVSERAREGGGERRVVIAGERRCVGVTRRVCEYASRQCKIIYGALLAQQTPVSSCNLRV